MGKRGPQKGSRHGRPNVRTEDLILRIRAMGFDPIDEAIKLLRVPRDKSKLRDIDRANICIALAKFIYPTRKAIEAPPPAEPPTDVTYIAEWGNRHEPSDANDE